jgi:hypothetical protein
MFFTAYFSPKFAMFILPHLPKGLAKDTFLWNWHHRFGDISDKLSVCLISAQNSQKKSDKNNYFRKPLM